jgi:hypothetical protein
VIRPQLNLVEYFPNITLSYLEKAAARVDKPMYAIDDQTAIQVVDGNVGVISEGEWKLFEKEQRDKKSSGSQRRHCYLRLPELALSDYDSTGGESWEGIRCRIRSRRQRFASRADIAHVFRGLLLLSKVP